LLADLHRHAPQISLGARDHRKIRFLTCQFVRGKPLSQFTGTRFHRVIDQFRWVMGLVANPMLRPALKLPFLGNEEGGL
jgi:hypothetical protein